jgi:glycosyltransferase involved in cell wall biosynthesis
MTLETNSGTAMATSHSERPSAPLPAHPPPGAPQVSIVMSTYNRGLLLDDAVRSVLAQHEPTAPPFELIVVDNNSTDGTREIVERFANLDGRVRYLFEAQQGLSYARNAGIRAARAPIIAFTDDDVRAEPDWVSAIVRAFQEHPDADFVGGRVLPVWPDAPPAWLTRDHWTPLALADYGDAPIAVTSRRSICLVGANLSFRRPVFDLVGEFGADFQRVKDGIGSLEDHEFLLRLLRLGRSGVYDPRITLYAEIAANRLERAYHRRWHTGHGHFHALLRSEEMEHTSVGTLFGVPAHLYRQALGDIVGWLRAHAAGDTARRFHHEVRLRFFHGFFRTRRREFVGNRPHRRGGELWRMVRELLRRRGPRPQPAGSGSRGE